MVIALLCPSVVFAINPPRHNVLDVKYRASLPTETANPVGHPFIYDGIADEAVWEGLEWHNIETNFNKESNAPTSTDDFSARFKVYHNGKNFCVYVEGKDDLNISPKSNMLKDKVELYFGMKIHPDYDPVTVSAQSPSGRQVVVVMREDSTVGGNGNKDNPWQRETGFYGQYDGQEWAKTNGVTYGVKLGTGTFSAEIVVNQLVLTYKNEDEEVFQTNFCKDSIDFDINIYDIDIENGNWNTDKTVMTWNVTGTYGQLWDKYEEIGYANLAECPDVAIAQTATNQVSVMPNPVNDVLKISTGTAANIEIYNITGARVMNLNNATQANVSGLASGIYMVRLTNNAGVQIGASRIVKK